MLVGPDGEAVGSVSGGCVEGAVYELGQQVVERGVPVLQRYGVTDDDAFAVGLTCGGILDVFVEQVDRETFPELGEIAADIEAGRPVAVATVIEPRTRRGWAGGSSSARTEARTATLGSRRGPTTPSRRRPRPARRRPHRDADLRPRRRAPRRGHAGLRRVVRARRRGCWSSARSTSPPPWPGSASFLGYHVTVCDARPVFATASRFPEADEVVVELAAPLPRPRVEAGRIDGRTVLCVLTHDPKFDVPVLEVALRLPEVAYVGAMGSRRTHDDRLERLREAGVTEEELARLSSPIGLDLGARTPEETAVSIAAEIIAGRWGGTGDRLLGDRRPDPQPLDVRERLTHTGTVTTETVNRYRHRAGLLPAWSPPRSRTPRAGSSPVRTAACRPRG